MDQINRALTAGAGVLGLVYLFGLGAVALRLTLNHLPIESVSRTDSRVSARPG